MKLRKIGEDAYQHKTDLMQIDISFSASKGNEPCGWKVVTKTMTDTNEHVDELTLQDAINFAREMWANLIGGEFE